MGELSPKVTERARTLTRTCRRGNSIALTEGLLIAAWQLCPAGLALSVIAPQCHLSQRERLSGGVAPKRYSLYIDTSLVYPESMIK